MVREDMWSGYRERLYQGQRCVSASKAVRVTARAGWRYYNVLTITFLDDQGAMVRSESVPAGRFNQGQTCTGRWLRYQDGRWVVSTTPTGAER